MMTQTITVPYGSWSNLIDLEIVATPCMIPGFGAFFVHRAVDRLAPADSRRPYVVTHADTKCRVPESNGSSEKQAIRRAMKFLTRQGHDAFIDAVREAKKRLGRTS